MVTYRPGLIFEKWWGTLIGVNFLKYIHICIVHIFLALIASSFFVRPPLLRISNLSGCEWQPQRPDNYGSGTHLEGFE
jgi:hypothetical protein